MGFDPQSFQNLKSLSKSEQIAVDHFRKNPGGRGFFSVAEIMAKHQELDEAVQLLMYGLERHPSYSVARVYLAQLLLKRGDYRSSFDTLDNSPLPLKGNLTASLLRIKLAVLLGLNEEVSQLCKELSQHEFHDKEADSILKNFDVKPFEQLRREIADLLRIPLSSLPHLSGSSSTGVESKAPLTEKLHVPVDSSSVSSSPEIESDKHFRKRVAQGFFASSIGELFQKSASPVSSPESLEPLTLARLLRRQGLYAKAAETYQRLVHEMPHNDLIRREYKEICELRDAQKKIDQSIRPEVVVAMDKVRKIDDRLRLLNELLSSLDRLHHEFA